MMNVFGFPFKKKITYLNKATKIFFYVIFWKLYSFKFHM